QHNTYWTQSQARVTNALERIRPLSPSHTRGGSRMRESRTYGSVRGAGDETHVPTATAARIHVAARRRGCGVAARRPRAAGGQAADHRVPVLWHANKPAHMGRRICAAPARTRLDRGPHRRDRLSLGGGTP